MTKKATTAAETRRFQWTRTLGVLVLVGGPAIGDAIPPPIKLFAAADWIHAMKPRRVMLDLDGVFADYTRAFLKIADEMFGIFAEHGPVVTVTSWNFGDVGLSKEQVNAVFRETQARENFWEHLEPLIRPEDTRALQALVHDAGWEFYAITARYPTAGHSILVQTHRWLRRALGPEYAISVIPAENKADVCAVLEVDYAIEDSPVYSRELHEAGVHTTIIDRPYNRDLKIPAIPRVATVEEFCEFLGEQQPPMQPSDPDAAARAGPEDQESL